MSNISINFQALTEVSDHCKFIGHYLDWANKVVVEGSPFPFVLYRGQADYQWELLPTIARSKLPLDYLIQFESNTIKKYRNEFNLKEWRETDILAFAQHHGSPTRLLDWSGNPLVSLWFTVENSEYDSIDGVIYQSGLIGITESKAIFSMENIMFPESDGYNCKMPPIQFFQGDKSTERISKQDSVFSMCKYDPKLFFTPLDKVTLHDKNLSHQRVQISS